MQRLYLITVRWVVTPVNPSLIDAALNIHGDWLRFHNAAWFSWTTSRTVDLDRSVRAQLKPDDGVLIIPVDPTDLAGWAPEWVWQWFYAKRR